MQKRMHNVQTMWGKKWQNSECFGYRTMSGQNIFSRDWPSLACLNP